MDTQPEYDLSSYLAEENSRLRRAGCKMAAAALYVARESDGVHRLMLTVAEWAQVVADEGRRGSQVMDSQQEEDGVQQPTLDKPDAVTREAEAWLKQVSPSSCSECPAYRTRGHVDGRCWSKKTCLAHKKAAPNDQAQRPMKPQEGRGE